MDEDEQRLVLVVEDHPVNQVLAVAQLEQLGYRTVVTASGWRALEEIERQQFDVVLMDWQLSDIDGLETTRQIRERENTRGTHRLPIVAITANTMPGDRQRCIDAGMDDFLSKPISLEDLRGALERALPSESPSQGIAGPPPAQDFEKKSGAISRLIDDLGDVSVVATILSTYLHELPMRTNDVMDALTSGDMDRARSIAHMIKSTSEALGQTDLATISRQIEMLTAVDSTSIAELEGEVRRATAKAHLRLSAIRDDLAGRH